MYNFRSATSVDFEHVFVNIRELILDKTVQLSSRQDVF